MKYLVLSLVGLGLGVEGQIGGGGFSIPSSSPSSSGPITSTSAVVATNPIQSAGVYNANFIVPDTIGLGAPTSISWTLETAAQVIGSPLKLVLCDTFANSTEIATQANTQAIVQLRACTNNTAPTSGVSDCVFTYGYPAVFSLNDSEKAVYTFISTSITKYIPGSSGTLGSQFFLCFGKASTSKLGAFECHAPSPYFSIIEDSGRRSQIPSEHIQPLKGTVFPRAGPIIEPILISQYNPVLAYAGQPTDNIDNLFAQTTTKSSSSGATTPSPTQTTSSSTTSASSSTASPTTTTATTSTSSKTSNGLSTGAKVGIALGALALVALLLLLALFFLRRKHRSKSHSATFEENKSIPEQAMLTRDMHNDSFQSRNDILAKKDKVTKSSTTAIPTTSPPTAGAVPRRKPIANSTPSPPSDTLATQAHNENLSRGMSTISRVSEPNTTHAETYHDNGNSSGLGTRVPLLREEGMTAEQMARLEEEERRIDAAIAEAEGHGR